MDASVLISEYRGKYRTFISEYCGMCGYTNITDLKNLDYIAIKSKYKLSNEEIREMKNCLNTYNTTDIEAIEAIETTVEDVVGYEAQELNFIQEYDKDMNNEISFTSEKIHRKNNNEDSNINDVVEYEDKCNGCEDIDDLKVHQSEDYKIGQISAGYCETYNNIGNLMLSVRATNALWNAGIKSVEQLITIASEDILSIKNIGTKTLHEILNIKKRLEEELNESPEEFHFEGNRQISENIKNYLEYFFENKENSTWKSPNLLEYEEQIISEIDYSVTIIGNELARMAYFEPDKCSKYINCLQSFSFKCNKKKLLSEKANLILQSKRNNKLLSYFNTCELLRKKVRFSDDNVILNLNIINEGYTINKLLEDICTKYVSDKEEKEIEEIIDFLCMDLNKIICDALECLKLKNDKAYSVLLKRAKGDTLQVIADDVNLTRERIRQLEKKAVFYFEKYIHGKGIEILDYISADLDDDYFLTSDELREYFKNIELFELVFYIESNFSLSTKFDFDKVLRAFRRKGNNAITNISFEEFPEIVFDNEVEQLILEYCKKNNVTYEEMKIQFNHIYKHIGKIFYRYRLTKEIIYEYIIERFYPSGIRLYDEDELSNFRRLINDKFGDIKLPNNNRAFEARISAIAILCDRGMYIHKSRIKVTDSIINAIDRYVENMTRDSISFNELYEVFKDELAVNTNIGNRYFLQGVVKWKLRDKYHYTRDYLSKTGEITIASDLERFIEEKGRIHKRNIFEHFAGMTEIVLNLYSVQNRNIIMLDGGEYMHSSQLNIIEDDYLIKDYLNKQIAEYPISSRKLLVQMWVDYPEFLIRNRINTHSELFGSLRYMFGEDFKFSRPFIACKSCDDITNLSVIKQYLSEYDSITISEMLDIFDDNHIKYFSIRVAIRNINDEFLRINEDTLMRYNTEEFNDEILQNIFDLLQEAMGEKGYISTRNMTDFMFYPEVNSEWNTFLLRGIVERYFSERINMIDIPTTETYVMNTIFVSDDIEAETYEQLLTYVLQHEHNKEPFNSMQEIVDWLKREGFFINEPCKVLESNVVYIDEYGNIIIN